MSTQDGTVQAEWRKSEDGDPVVVIPKEVCSEDVDFQYDVARGSVERQHPFPRRNPINMKPEGLFFPQKVRKNGQILTTIRPSVVKAKQYKE